MNILFDHQIYNNQKYGGISRYFYELSKGLVKRGVDVKNTIYFSDNEFTPDKDIFNARPLTSFQFKGRGKLKRFLNRKISEQSIKKGDFDLFHPTYYDTYFIDKSITKKPFVVTFYDLIHEKFNAEYPDQFTGMEQVIAERKKLLNHCAKVIAISHSTKADIMEYYGVDENRIEVTHLASSMDTSLLNENTSLGRYILYVGNRSGYKNFDPFVKAAAPLLKQDRTLKIIAAGGGAFTPAEVAFYDNLGVKNQIVHKPINDKILVELYYNAVCFAFPSRYEGFGIPVLEAFSCHCPSLLSNISSLPEVGGDAAIYFDPTSELDMREKLASVLSSESLRSELKEKGLRQASLFSWQTMADQTLEVYRSIL